MKSFSVTASTISPTDLGAFIREQYLLDSNYICKLFRTGINHTYFISNKENTYVARVYSHNWRSKNEISAELKLLTLLKQNDLNISFPIADRNGQLIHEVNAPEGLRYLVLFSFAEGEKIRFIDEATCFSIGALMAKIHDLTSNNSIDRISYTKESLLEMPYEHLKPFFSEQLPEMKFIKNIGNLFEATDFKNTSQGVVHLDIWYDNMAITNEKEITIFDFDFCGNGPQILDVGYFCKQLFHIETDKTTYEVKKKSFLEGYQSVRALSIAEVDFIPKAGLAVFVFYLGVQAQRFDWSNIFLSENYLKMFYIPRLQSWMDYNNLHKITD